MEASFPVDELRDRALSTLAERAALVVTSPTGSGKSTRLPRWLAEKGRVLVVEPRRVACRSLAAFVAEQEGTRLGERVGSVVRGERRADEKTRIVFATPGIVLRWMARDRLASFDFVVLDEFHERGIDGDLLLALLRSTSERPKLVVLSATLDGDRVATHLDGVHLRSEGRQFPVELEHLGAGDELPHSRDLGPRLRRALTRCRERPGDVLVFLPGKGEIRQAERALDSEPELVLPLHGRLSLQDQSRVFAKASRRKIVLTTNVAETSLTIDGIGSVIDFGLVRRSAWYRGRSCLGLFPIAMDSAEQRRGRAGRTGPGLCLRMWSPLVRLEERTPPEIHRESLVSLALASAACKADPGRLPWLDAPRDDALAEARDELLALDALDGDSLSESGRHLFGLPLDAALGKLLVAAKEQGLASEFCDLVAALSIDRPLFVGERPRDPEQDLRARGCDGLALIAALRIGDRHPDQVDRHAMEEARRVARELRQALALDPALPMDIPNNSEALARCALAADPRCAHIARRRKRAIAWSPGGSELLLDPRSAVDEEKHDAIAVLGTRALSGEHGKLKIIATCALPLRLRWLADAGLGTQELREPKITKGRLVAVVERRYAEKLIDREEREPEGAAAREAIARLFREGRFGATLRDEAVLRLDEARLLADLHRAERLPLLLVHAPLSTWPAWSLFGGDDPVLSGEDDEDDPLIRFLLRHLEELGVESWDDHQLLDREDLLPPALPDDARTSLERDWPLRPTLPGGRWRARIHAGRREVILEPVESKGKKAPDPRQLPTWGGFRVLIEQGGRTKTLRGR